MLRELIRRMFKTKQEDDDPPEDATEEICLPMVDQKRASVPTPSRLQRDVPVSSPKQDPLRQQLKPELELLALIRSDIDFAALWLPDGAEPEGRQLIRLVALLSQWDQLLQLWDRLAERCKQARRPATVAERQVLTIAVDIHNLIWQSKAARLQPATLGAAFDFNRHERGVPTGDSVRAEWLSGLVNAAGTLQKKPLVET